jgi:hypothetical protein
VLSGSAVVISIAFVQLHYFLDFRIIYGPNRNHSQKLSVWVILAGLQASSQKREAKSSSKTPVTQKANDKARA